jgi:hypothetical protein
MVPAIRGMHGRIRRMRGQIGGMHGCIGVMGVPLCERGARIFFIDARIPWMHA